MKLNETIKMMDSVDYKERFNGRVFTVKNQNDWIK